MPKFFVCRTEEEGYQAFEIKPLAEFMNEPENPEIEEVIQEYLELQETVEILNASVEAIIANEPKPVDGVKTRIKDVLLDGINEALEEIQYTVTQANILERLEMLKKTAREMEERGQPIPDWLIANYENAFLYSKVIKYELDLIGRDIVGEFDNEEQAIEAAQNSVATRSLEELFKISAEYFNDESRAYDEFQRMYDENRSKGSDRTQLETLVQKQKLDEQRRQLDEKMMTARFYEKNKPRIELARQKLEESQNNDPITGIDLTKEDYPDGIQATLNFQRKYGSRSQNPEELNNQNPEEILPNIKHESLRSLYRPDGGATHTFQKYRNRDQNQGMGGRS